MSKLSGKGWCKENRKQEEAANQHWSSEQPGVQLVVDQVLVSF